MNAGVGSERSLAHAGWNRADVRPRTAHGLTVSERRLLLALVDLALANGSLLLAVELWTDYFTLASAFVLLAAGKWFITLSVMWLFFGSVLDIYDLRRTSSLLGSVSNTLVTGLVVGIAYRLTPWLTPPAEPRLLSFTFVGLLITTIPAWRALYVRFLLQPAFRRKALIIGDDATARRFQREVSETLVTPQANPFQGSGYEIVGIMDAFPMDGEHTLDPAHALLRLVIQHDLDEVLISEQFGLSPALQEALLDCRELGIQVNPLALAYERLSERLPVEYVERDLSLIVSQADGPATRLYWAVKRLLDLGLALVGALAMLLLAPWLALVNACTSRGPLFYRQHRVGRGGCSFVMLKFRTMIMDAEGGEGAVWATKHDPRVTPFGRWLRRTRLDELPQAINVLRGEMSFVGPRPERPELVGEISRSLPIYRGRHAVRPGITGWAQIHFRYGQSIEDARTKLEYDLYYVKHCSLLLDVMILLRTMSVMLRAEGT
jgi:exopolysaccharide biosynthesis polyprenyl glycosylphosphotransferase